MIPAKSSVRYFNQIVEKTLDLFDRCVVLETFRERAQGAKNVVATAQTGASQWRSTNNSLGYIVERGLLCSVYEQRSVNGTVCMGAGNCV